LRSFFLYDYCIAGSPGFNHPRSAYRKHYSTETSLFHLLDSIYRAADNGRATLLLSPNLSAAFDTIDHNILLNHLTSSFGIMGSSSHNWIKSYLSNRFFSVPYAFMLHSSFGVPRLSVLGPSFPCKSHLLLQLYPLIVSINDTQPFLFRSPASLSSSLCSLQWCVYSHHNGLVLNPTKTKAICFGPNLRLKSLSNLTSMAVARSSVSLVDYVKLLGVTFDSHLNFDEHISNVCSSSYFHISAIFDLSLTQKLPRTSPELLSVPN